MSELDEQAVEAAAKALYTTWLDGPGAACMEPWSDDEDDETDWQSVARNDAITSITAYLAAADAIGRERVSEATVTHIVGLLKPWAEFFAPYVHDDNEWYRNGYIDGKDAGSIGEACAEAIALLTAQPEPGTHDDAGQPAEGGVTG